MDETRRSTGYLPYGGRMVEHDGDDIVFRMEAIPYFDLNHWELYGGFKNPDIYHGRDLPMAH